MKFFQPALTERRVPGDRTAGELDREWLVTNGLGGYASGTIAGISTRRFHGLLVAALPAPYGRTMMLNHLEETFSNASGRFRLTADDLSVATRTDQVSPFLQSFVMENGLPVFRYAGEGFLLEKRICMVHRQNTTYITYRLLEGEMGSLEIRPGIDVRPHEGHLGKTKTEDYRFSAVLQGYELNVDLGLPSLKLRWPGEAASFQLSFGQFTDLRYRVEENRGYDWEGDLWSPGCFTVQLKKNLSASLVASTESWDSIGAFAPESAFQAESERRRRLLRVAPEEAQTGVMAELVLAADQFLIAPVGRTVDVVQAHAIGDEVRTVIAGYHWFTDWGRDTMISLEGLTLSTGRAREAEYILRNFGKYLRNGLIPNMFPEGKTSGLYHTADATLWYFHAIDRYFRETQDTETLALLLPKMLDVLDHHRKGTDFGIGVDPADHLLRQGAAGYQLTWMDAKAGDWVVTPRRGKAVEINALWYNALCITADWLSISGDHSQAECVGSEAARVKESFNDRFWNSDSGCCFDVIDGEEIQADSSLRPNQILAISLEYPVLAPERWPMVLMVVRDHLLTPVGLRSLAPSNADYKARYDGDLKMRDAAYHQGTVWAWLVGPLFDAWVKTYPADVETAQGFLCGLEEHMSDAGVGTISEVFDADPPYQARGCIAQAWSVAEMLRCSLKARRLMAAKLKE